MLVFVQSVLYAHIKSKRILNDLVLMLIFGRYETLFFNFR